MKVLMVGLYPPHLGGIASYVYHLGKELEKKGISVYVVTYGKSDDPYVYGTYVLPVARGPSFMVTGLQKTLKAIRTEEVDIIHAHYLVPPGLVGVFSKKISGLPLVVTCHGSDVFVFSKGWKRRISTYVVKNADCVVTNSEATSSAVRKLGGVPRFVPSGVDLNEFKPLGFEREAVTYVGALTWVKGVDAFLRAMEGIEEKVWIVGDGPERGNLERLARTLRVDCTFWGFRTDTAHLMNRSKVVVLPSRSEGFGLSLLEAMACGTPVIGRRTGGIPELVNGENGFLFDSEEELHTFVETLLKDRKMWETAREKGLKTASQWSWERTALSYGEIYSALSD